MLHYLVELKTTILVPTSSGIKKPISVPLVLLYEGNDVENAYGYSSEDENQYISITIFGDGVRLRELKVADRKRITVAYDKIAELNSEISELETELQKKEIEIAHYKELMKLHKFTKE